MVGRALTAGEGRRVAVPNFGRAALLRRRPCTLGVACSAGVLLAMTIGAATTVSKIKVIQGQSRLFKVIQGKFNIFFFLGLARLKKCGSHSERRFLGSGEALAREQVF